MADNFMVGESLVGDGNEVAHIDLIIGSKSGPAGAAFVQRLADQTAGHNGLLAVLAPNVPAKPDTVMFNKVTIKGAGQAVQMFGPAQAAVAKAVVDSVADGTIPKASANDLCVIVGRVHPLAGVGQQEDLRLQLPGDQGVDLAGDEEPALDGRGPLQEGYGQAPVRVSAAHRPRAWTSAAPTRELAGVQAASGGGPPGPPASSPARQRPPVTCPSGMLCIAQRARSSRTTRGGAN